MSDPSSERLKYKGRLVEKEVSANGLKIRCEDLFGALRDQLDPTLPLDELDSERIQQAAFNFCLTLADYKLARREITRIKEILGDR